VTDGRGGRDDAEGLTDVQATIAFAGVALLFSVVQFAAARFSVADENVYYYMGKLVADGALPYRDFRFAHPPLKLLPPAALFAAFGFHFKLLKLIPIVAADAAAALLFAYVRRAAGATAACLGAALFLFSMTNLACGGYYTGVETTVAFVFGGLLALQRGRPAIAGACLAAASLVGLYAGVAVVVAAAWLAWTDRRALLRFVVAFAVVFGAVNALCFVVGGAAYWREVFAFHAKKTADETTSKSEIVGAMLGFDPAVLALAALSLVLRRKGFGLTLAVGGAFLAAIVSFSSIHPYYMLLCVPFLCGAAADALVAAPAFVRVPRRWTTFPAALVVIALGAVAARRAEPIVARQTLPDAPAIAAEVRRLSDPGDTLFGDAAVVPLVALLADRGIVSRHVDTNAKVYMTGVDDLLDVSRELASPGRRVVLVRDIRVNENLSLASGPMVDDAFREFVNARYTRAATFPRREDPREQIVLLVRNGR